MTTEPEIIEVDVHVDSPMDRFYTAAENGHTTSMIMLIGVAAPNPSLSSYASGLLSMLSACIAAPEWAMAWYRELRVSAPAIVDAGQNLIKALPITVRDEEDDDAGS